MSIELLLEVVMNVFIAGAAVWLTAAETWKQLKRVLTPARV